MRYGIVQHALGVRAPKSLAARGGLARTFGGLAGFLAITILCSGFYILEDALTNPLTEGAPAVLSAAFLITLAAILLFFHIKPVKRSRTMSPEHSVDAAFAEKRLLFKSTAGERKDHSGNNLPYQRVYVDHSLIRP